MTAAWWIGCVPLVIAATAVADPPPLAGAGPGIDARLDGCDGLPARAQIARTQAVGEDAVHAVARSGERYLVFPAGDGRGCAVYSLGGPAARTSGQLGDAGGARAVALKPSRCASGSCVIALAVCGKQGGPVAALRTDFDCDEGVELRALKLFGSRDSLELVCRASSGAGWQERRALIEISGGLAVRYVLDTGSYIAAAPEEKKAGGCASRPVGSLRVERPGDRPLLRVIDPASGPLQDGKGTLPARQLVYDPAKHEFAPSGAPDVPTQVDARAGCHRR
jgi:hypothetical protein